MYRDHETGKEGEDIACEYLLKHKIELIERNFRCKMGEIDIIAKEGKELVFIEVKTRGQKHYGTPAEAVNRRKKRHIYHVAEYYLMLHHIENVYCRIDVIEVYLHGKEVKINHIRNCISDRPYWTILEEKERNGNDEFEVFYESN